LKKIRCPTGSEDVRQAMREVEAYRRFKCVDFCVPRLPLVVLIRTWVFIQASEYHSHSREQSSVTPPVIALNPLEDSAVVQDPDGEGKIVYLFLPLYKVRWCHTRTAQTHNLAYSEATCKTLSTHTRSTVPTSLKKRWSGFSKAHAKLSARCTSIKPQPVLNPVRTHKPHRVRTLAGFLESSNPVVFRNPNTIPTTKMMMGSLKLMGTKREGTHTMVRAQYPSPTNSRARKAEVRVGTKRAG
jgi:hypothetical protein